MLLLFLLRTALFSYGEHEFESVKLIYFTRTSIAVDGRDISPLVSVAQFMHHALARNMVGQAAEGLQANYIGYAGVDELDHFASQEPAFTGHIPQAYMAGRHLSCLIDGMGRREMTALFKCLFHGATEEFKYLDEHLAKDFFLVGTGEQLPLGNGIIA